MTAEPVQQRRQYDSPLRRQRAAETRERIVAAGADLLHGFPVWDWRALTVRGVAQRAGVNERTVYRHFPSERDLRDAVMVRLEEESGVDLEGLDLEGLQDITARMFRHVSSFPIEPRTPPDPTVAAANRRQRQALLSAVGPWTEDWPPTDRAIAAAMLDVLWSVVSYERLVSGWELDSGTAIRGITWVIGLVEDAVRRGARPDPPTATRNDARDGRRAGEGFRLGRRS
jgi:AcrR family transcriptional regulator